MISNFVGVSGTI